MIIRREESYKRYDQHATATDPGADSDLLVVEFTQKTKLMKVRVKCNEANTFKIVARDHDASNAVTKDFIHLEGAGSEVDLAESTDNPILEIGGNREIAIKVVNAGNGTYRASISALEKEG